MAPPRGTGRTRPSPAAGLGGRLIVAAPETQGGPERSVLLIVRHDEDGSLLLVLNDPAFPSRRLPFLAWRSLAAHPAVVFDGGPEMTDAHLCLSRLAVPAGDQEWSRRVTDRIHTIDLMRYRAANAGVAEIRVFAGCADWPAGELEQRLGSGEFRLAGPVDREPFTDEPHGLYRDACRRDDQTADWLRQAAAAGNHHAAGVLRLFPK